MNVFVTGAGGYIGGSISRVLIEGGCRVRTLARSQASAERLLSVGIEPVIGSLDDTDLVVHEAQRSDAVINAANSDHAGAVQSLISGLRGSGKLLIHTSGSSVVGDDARGQYASAKIFDSLDSLEINPSKRARHEVDEAVLGAALQGVRSVVICPSLIYGIGTGLNRNSVQIPLMVDNARQQGFVEIVGPGANIWSNVHIEDVVSLYLLALTNAPAGAFYFAENGEASFAELGAAIAGRMGLPGVKSLDPAIAAQRWGQPRAYFSLGSNSRVRSTRARRELLWAPRHVSVLDWIARELPV